MLNKEDFDFYYLIICSRGPGSETIMVSNRRHRRPCPHQLHRKDGPGAFISIWQFNISKKAPVHIGAW